MMYKSTYTQQDEIKVYRNSHPRIRKLYFFLNGLEIEKGEILQIIKFYTSEFMVRVEIVEQIHVTT